MTTRPALGPRAGEGHRCGMTSEQHAPTPEDTVTDVQIVEVSARDGLQNDPAILSTAQKLGLIERTVAAGLGRQEVA